MASQANRLLNVYLYLADYLLYEFFGLSNFALICNVPSAMRGDEYQIEGEGGEPVSYQDCYLKYILETQYSEGSFIPLANPLDVFMAVRWCKDLNQAVGEFDLEGFLEIAGYEDEQRIILCRLHFVFSGIDDSPRLFLLKQLAVSDAFYSESWGSSDLDEALVAMIAKHRKVEHKQVPTLPADIIFDDADVTILGRPGKVFGLEEE